MTTYDKEYTLRIRSEGSLNKQQRQTTLEREENPEFVELKMCSSQQQNYKTCKETESIPHTQGKSSQYNLSLRKPRCSTCQQQFQISYFKYVSRATGKHVKRTKGKCGSDTSPHEKYQ